MAKEGFKTVVGVLIPVVVLVLALVVHLNADDENKRPYNLGLLALACLGSILTLKLLCADFYKKRWHSILLFGTAIVIASMIISANHEAYDHVWAAVVICGLHLLIVAVIYNRSRPSETSRYQMSDNTKGYESKK